MDQDTVDSTPKPEDKQTGDTEGSYSQTLQQHTSLNVLHDAEEMTTKQDYSSSMLAMNNNHIKDVENKTKGSLIKSEAEELGANIEDEGLAGKRNVICDNELNHLLKHIVQNDLRLESIHHVVINLSSYIIFFESSNFMASKNKLPFP